MRLLSVCGEGGLVGEDGSWTVCTMDGILKCDDEMFDVDSIAVLDCLIWVKSRVEVMTLHREKLELQERRRCTTLTCNFFLFVFQLAQLCVVRKQYSRDPHHRTVRFDVADRLIILLSSRSVESVPRSSRTKAALSVISQGTN